MADHRSRRKGSTYRLVKSMYLVVVCRMNVGQKIDVKEWNVTCLIVLEKDSEENDG